MFIHNVFLKDCANSKTSASMFTKLFVKDLTHVRVCLFFFQIILTMIKDYRQQPKYGGGAFRDRMCRAILATKYRRMITTIFFAAKGIVTYEVIFFTFPFF